MSSSMASRIISRNIAAPTLRSSIRTQRTFTTSSGRLNTANTAANGNPSYPAFSLKHISANPTTRYLVAGGLLTMGFLEGAAWVKFGPQILGTAEEGSNATKQ